MALLDVSKAAQYGLSATWAEQVFSGKMALGSISVDYTDTCKDQDTWGNCVSGPSQRSQNAVFGAGSTARGQGLSVNGGNFLAADGNTMSAFNSIASISNKSSPMNFSGVVLVSGNRNNSTTNAGINLYIDKSSFNPKIIEFVSNGSSATIGEGKVTASNKQMAAGAGSSVEFTFNPSANPTLSLEYTGKNQVSSAISNGTINSSSNSWKALVSISNSNKASVGVTGLVNASTSNETTLKAGWQAAWKNINEANFTDELTNSSTDSSTVSISINLNGLAENPDGTYKLQGVNPVVNGKAESGVSQPSTTNFVPGQRYKAAIQYNQSEVENTVSGSYNIIGSTGSVVARNVGGSKIGDVVSLTAAQAIAAADQYQGSYIFGYGADSVGNLSRTGTSVPFNGSSVYTTSLQTDFTVNYYAVPDPSSALMSTSPTSSLGLRNKTGSVSKYNLGLVDSELIEAGNGVWLALETLDGDQSIVSGGGSNSNVVEASPNGRHKFINFENSLLYGNRFADVVELTKASDTNNTVYTEEGNDKVTASAGNNSVVLGEGNDTYHFKGGQNHQVTLGDGEDKFVIHELVEDAFHISDFDYIEDMFVFKGGLKADNFKTKLINPGDPTNLDGASLEFYSGSVKVGTASIDRRSKSYDALTDNKLAMELAFLNSKYYNLDAINDVMNGATLPNQVDMFTDTVLGQGLLTKKTIDPGDWSEMSNKKRADIVNNVMKSIDGATTGKKYWKDILVGQGSAVNDFTIEMVRDSLWWAGSDQSQDALA